MNTKTLPTLILAAFLATPLLLAACSHEISHTETDKPGWFGGRTQTESTVTRNADGTISTESSRQTTK